MSEYSNLVKTLRIAAAEVEHGRFVHKHGARELLAEAADRIAALEAELAEVRQEADMHASDHAAISLKFEASESQAAAMRKALEGVTQHNDNPRETYGDSSIGKALDALATDAGKEVLAVLEAAREHLRFPCGTSVRALRDALRALDGSKTDV